MDYKLMTAPCGLDCFNCPVFLAKDNEQIRKIVAEKTGLPFEIAYCEGCNPQKGVMHQFGKTDLNTLADGMTQTKVRRIVSPGLM